MKLHVAETVQNEKTVDFPKEITISTPDSLRIAASFDHMAADMKDNYRANKNFIEADCIVGDLDNDHSDDPADWRTPDDLADDLPDVHFYSVRSRNYMKPKHDKQPRGKWHLYFPCSKTIANIDEFEQLHKKLSKSFCYIDDNAAKPAQMTFGVEDPYVEEYVGDKFIDEYLASVEVDDHIADSACNKPEQVDLSVDADTVERIEQALAAIPIKAKDEHGKHVVSYADWIHVGMALYNCGMSFEVFDAWSSKDESRYDGTEATLKKWNSFRNSESRWNAGTIFNMLKRFQTPKDNSTTAPSGGLDLAHALQTADYIEEQEAEWLIPEFMPRYQITTLAGDGGTGKTTIECALAAAITTGSQCFMTEHSIPENFTSEPENVLFLSAEDDFSRVLKRKLRKAGADLSRVYTLPISSPLFQKVKFASDELEQLIRECHPSLVIFDPIQAFVPPDIQMGWRNAMRQCLSPLIGYGEKYGASFLIICHTNKQSGSSGRRRIAESADIWDISRSVLMVGDTGEDGCKYLSHEKSNYGELQQTILYKLDGERIIYEGRSELRDADYIRKDRTAKPAPARDEAKQMIINALTENGGHMKSTDLDSVLIGQGVTRITRNRAKSELKDTKVIKYSKDDFNGEWITSLVKSGHE